MKTIVINTPKPYDVLIGRGNLLDFGQIFGERFPSSKIAIIADERVFSLHGKTLLSSLESTGRELCVFTLPSGEQSKSLDMLEQVLGFLCENEITKPDALIAFGGGVCGDLSGFAASVYLRGIALVNIPTTLLAQVDSSVGGKNAINLNAGKNLAGTVYQPSLVFCDVDLLKTLPKCELSCGIAECIKCGVIASKALFASLSCGRSLDDLEHIICECLKIKGSFVELDEQDFGARRKLNFGHTSAHAIEKCSNFKISHGEAVSIGMCIATDYAVKIGFCKSEVAAQIRCALIANTLPTACEFSGAELATAALSDKKRRGDKISVILPREIGNCEIVDIPTLKLEQFFNAEEERIL